MRAAGREIGVGCEACHGPGRAHVERAQPARPATIRGRRPIPSGCSMRAAAVTRGGSSAPRTRRATSSSTRSSRSCSTRTSYHPDGQVKEELYELVSFQKSKMFQEGVRCWNCHDPTPTARRRTATRSVSRCHEATYDTRGAHASPGGSAGADCRGCHMPVTVYMQRDPRHDHSFLRPDPEATLATGVPNACNRCHADQDAGVGRRARADLVSRRPHARRHARDRRPRSSHRRAPATRRACRD